MADGRMKSSVLGSSGIEASVVAFGAWAIGGSLWGGTDEEESVSAIRASLDAGVTLIDTAPVYGFGLSEELVGRAIKGRREEVILATKCGLVWEWEGNEGGGEIDGKKVYRCLGRDSIRREAEASLMRLGTDYIDLYQVHWPESTTSVEETMSALLELKQEGKVKAIGVSNFSGELLEEYRSFGKIESDQEPYNMIDRRKEANVSYCKDANMAFLAYSPLDRGLLTGKVTHDRKFKDGDMRRKRASFSRDNIKRVLVMLDELKPVAEKYSATLAQLVIAWTVLRPGVSHVLCGARRPNQALENAAAGRIELSSSDIAGIDEVIEKHAEGIKH